MPAATQRLQRVGLELGPVRVPVLVLVLAQVRLGQAAAHLQEELEPQIRFWERERQRYVHFFCSAPSITLLT